MSDGSAILEILCSSVDLMSLIYICRLHVKLSSVPSLILSSNVRIQVIKELVNDRYNRNHGHEDILKVTNIIAMNRDFITRVLLLSDFAEKSLMIELNHVKIDVLNDMILLPFTETCVNCNELLGSYRCKPIHIIDCFKIIRAVAVSAECKSCSLLYNHSSWSSLKYRWRKISSGSLNSAFKVFYLCDSFGFTHLVFFDYTCQLSNNQCPFQAFCRTLIDRYNYEQQNNGIIFQLIRLTKLFQGHWILYQIVLFELMLGKTLLVTLPISLNRSELNNHFEKCSNWWYHLFTTFWSRHKVIPNIKCNQLNCSRCVIVDGHQKTRRIVCSFKDVVDTTIDEMNSVEIGCPYGPCRRTQSCNSGKFEN